MSQRPALIALSLLVLVLACPSYAQDFASGPAREGKPDPGIEQKALTLLKAISDQVTNLRSATNRVRAECVVADLLWARDEKRARALFKAAAEDLKSRIADLDYSDHQVYQELADINQQRQELVTRLAAHDPEMALTFLRQTRIQAGDARATATNESNLELHLATLMAAKDPARAFQIARASLVHGLSWNMSALLNRLQQKDPKSAQTLYTEMVARIKESDLGRNQELVYIAWSLMSSFPPPQANEDTYRDLITVLVNAALANTPGNQFNLNLAQNLHHQINAAMPQIEKFAPARVADLRQWSQGTERFLDPNTRMHRELSHLSQNGSVEDVLALVSKYPAEYQSQIYQNAAWKAFSAGDHYRARQIVNDYVSDPIQRGHMLEQFDNQLLYSAANENKIAETQRLLSKVKTVDRKVQILTEMARRLADKGDKTGALNLLSEARNLVDSSTPDSKQSLAQIQLAHSYSSLDLDQSFALLQPVVVRANELIAAAAVLDGVDFRYLKEGEWMMPGANMLGQLINSLNQTLGLLARLDFDRARALADQLQRPEVRLMVQLDLAQAGLSARPGMPMRVSSRGVMIFRH